MSGDFEDHCWRDVVSSDVLDLYSRYSREVFVGSSPALLAIDLYELAYEGGDLPISEISKTYPSSCGEYLLGCNRTDKAIFAAARSAKIPVFYSTMDVRPNSKPEGLNATKRRAPRNDAEAYAIRPEFRPEPDDVIISKQRASAIFGTPLQAHLTQLGIRTVIICGESPRVVCVRRRSMRIRTDFTLFSWRSAVLTGACCRTK